VLPLATVSLISTVVRIGGNLATRAFRLLAVAPVPGEILGTEGLLRRRLPTTERGNGVNITVSDETSRFRRRFLRFHAYLCSAVSATSISPGRIRIEFSRFGQVILLSFRRS
jgi:hypothetical protein